MNDLFAHATAPGQALVWGPAAASGLALLMAIAAVMLALPAPRKFLKSQRAAEQFRVSGRRRLDRLDGKLVEYEASVRKRERAAADAAESAVDGAGFAGEQPAATVLVPDARGVPELADVPESQALAEPQPVAQPQAVAEPEAAPVAPHDPLEGKRAHLRAFLAALLAAFDEWARLAGFPLDAAIGLRGEVDRLLQSIAPPAEESALNAVAYERLPLLLTETVKVMLSKTDRDADPERANRTLQQHIAQCMRAEVSWKLSLIDPVDGDRMNPQEHNSVGGVGGGDEARRGCVARTRVRGLRWAGQVALKAEVLEYD